MLLNTDKLISDVVEFTERRMPKAQSQALVDLETAFEQLQAENKALQEKYQAYTTGKAKNYHDVWCNASRDKPMGCSECSCTIGKQIKKLQAENKRLREELEIAKGNKRYGHDGKIESVYKPG